MEIDTSSAVKYHSGAFPPERLDYDRMLPALLKATDALARYDQMLKGMHNSEIFLAPLRGQEAVVSSRMEGTISTLDEILQLEAEYGDGEVVETEYRSDVLETALYQRALRTAQRQIAEGRPLSASLVKSMHQQLLSFGRGARKNPGAFKSEQNYIGDRGSSVIRFIPVAPENLESGIERLFQVANDESVPALIRAALCHVEFEALHPFKDGNGRVGRMLITLMLWSEAAISAPHFYISRYFEDHKDTYIARMREVSAQQAWEEWCIFFLEAVENQAIHNLEVAEKIQSLYEEMKIRFAEILSSKWSVAALDFVFTYPVFPNSRFRKGAGIPAQTAGRFSRVLLEHELIQTYHEAAGSRSAVYRFEPLMELVRA